MENGNSDDARVLAGPAACKRYSGPKPPSPENRKREESNICIKHDGLAEAMKRIPS